MSPLLIPPPADLSGFPSYELQPNHELFRIHWQRFGPWWFSHDAPLRFDLTLPYGTCYLAEDPLGAFVEAFQAARPVIRFAEIAERRLSRLHVPRRLVLADGTQSSALAFGVTAEIHSSPDRLATQLWARAASAAGFDGIRHFLRHDPAQQLVGVALFGDGGEATWSIADTRVIQLGHLDAVAQMFGILVQP